MPGNPEGEILSRLLLFSRRLKERGLRITPDRVIDTFRSLELVGLCRRGDFASALKANLASSREERIIFDELFEQFWSRAEEEEEGMALPASSEREGDEEARGGDFLLPFRQEIVPGGEGTPAEDLRIGYSPEEVLMNKEFSQFTREDREVLDREFVRLLSRLAMKATRRRKPSIRGREVDFRRSLRRTVRHGGEILVLLRRRRKARPLKVVGICDVSGSMDASTRFILQFLFGLLKAESLVGREAVVRGWYRRGPGPYFEMKEATFENGILTLTIPKAEVLKPKRIQVKTTG